jgi:glyoxylase-like metal-dependent hydrolase (beta-lactamase superfamily II)
MGRMKARQVTEHVFRVPLRIVNVFVIVLPDSLTLVDAGPSGSWPRVARAIRGLGRRPEEVTDIVVTHLHGDHTGALAEAKRATGARVWMHAADAALIREGWASRPWRGAPGSLIGALAARFFGRGTTRVEPVVVDREAQDGESPPVASWSPAGAAGPGQSDAGMLSAAGSLVALWTPGHTEGHMAYLWPGDKGVLFVGDAAARLARLHTGPLYEDYARGVESLARLGGLAFEVACFSHGRPLVGGAAEEFAKKWFRRPPPSP